jgi:hypothetical protein
MVERPLQRREVVGADQGEGGSSVAVDHDPVVLALDSIGDLGEVGLDLREGCRSNERMSGSWPSGSMNGKSSS